MAHAVNNVAYVTVPSALVSVALVTLLLAGCKEATAAADSANGQIAALQVANPLDCVQVDGYLDREGGNVRYTQLIVQGCICQRYVNGECTEGGFGRHLAHGAYVNYIWSGSQYVVAQQGFYRLGGAHGLHTHYDSASGAFSMAECHDNNQLVWRLLASEGATEQEALTKPCPTASWTPASEPAPTILAPPGVTFGP